MSIKSISELLFHKHSGGANSYLTKLEKHLKDYKNGKGYLSKDISFDIDNQAKENSQILGQANIKANTYYLNVQSAFTYNQRARFVNGVNSTTEKLEQITSPKVDPLDIVAPNKAIIDEVA